jgi:glycosyltransferase involved in cell wall biosynthesis
MNPRISVVIPLYNKEDYVLDCLKSLENQDFDDWECIIVDDGSLDASMKIVKDFIADSERSWTILTQNNSGPSSARNLGIRAASGDYIALLDADDIWLPTKLSKQLNYLDKHKDVDLLISNYAIFSQSGSFKLRAVRARNAHRQVRRWLDMRGFGGLVESTGMFRKIALSEELWFDEEMPTTEGLDFVIRWIFQKKVTVYQEILTLYRISENQLHTKQDLVKSNVTLVAERYPNLVANEFVLRRMHLAYFQLSELRGLPKGKILKTIFASRMHLNPFVLWMAFSIICRNLKATYLPKKIRRIIMASTKRD